jgi:hypothetical protein
LLLIIKIAIIIYMEPVSIYFGSYKYVVTVTTADKAAKLNDQQQARVYAIALHHLSLGKPQSTVILTGDKIEEGDLGKASQAFPQYAPLLTHVQNEGYKTVTHLWNGPDLPADPSAQPASSSPAARPPPEQNSKPADPPPSSPPSPVDEPISPAARKRLDSIPENDEKEPLSPVASNHELDPEPTHIRLRGLLNKFSNRGEERFEF